MDEIRLIQLIQSPSLLFGGTRLFAEHGGRHDGESVESRCVGPGAIGSRRRDVTDSNGPVSMMAAVASCSS